jgi:hypothetical protein
MVGTFVFNRTEDPDPLLRATACTKIFRPPSFEELDIKPGMVSGVCLVSDGTGYSFTSRLSSSTVTVCVGNAGNCKDGHGVKPITIAPGRTVDLDVPTRHWGWTDFLSASRNYPITIFGPDFPPVDLVISASPEYL